MAFCYPYPYSAHLQFIHSLQAPSPEIYLHKEVLVHSPGQREVHLLTITNSSQDLATQ
jgi:hypothetical protein